MRVSICIGSACHLKGSREVIKKLQHLVASHNLQDKVSLNGDFCTGNCERGVCVRVEDELFTVKPETAESFFEEQILSRLGN